MTTARQFALNAVPDLSVALMPGEAPEDVADALLETLTEQQDLPDELTRAAARAALVERIQEARIESMTPDQAWDAYVGVQSTREFVDNCEGILEDEVRDYVAGCETCSDLSDAERAAVARLLLQHIQANS